MSVGNRLLESGHYASQQIKQISGQLEKEWKAFAAALDERSTLLEMSASFHQKCDQVSRERVARRFIDSRLELYAVGLSEPFIPDVAESRVRFAMCLVCINCYFKPKRFSVLCHSHLLRCNIL